ncbi:hypothetical protein B0A49_05052 [Cryomyces minteri]|uniref:Major facilitator superfamily (MFS) profile domain-containing protein n=1 Tax=Cryomyces minteri TaxID=331657 RepID=A0A4U0XJZ3_9PEZI|nr:hypothetical protein B0A49_05052 [Cryomyces minteri]
MSFSDDIKRAAPFSAYDGRKAAVVADHEVVTVMGLEDADEALAFLQNHPKAAEIAVQGQAILDDPVQLKKLIRKIDLTIAPLLAAIFGGCLAYGVSFTHTRFASWRIFYVAIGAMTIVMGFLVIMFLPDSPVKAKRFTDAEKVAALLRTKDNPSGTQNSHVKKAQVFETFKDGRVWLVCLSTMLSSIPNGGISNFSSILLTTFGYTSQQALIMSLPAGAVGAACVLLVGWLSDRWRDRSIVMLICIIPTILGASLMIGLDPNGVPKNKAGLLAASFMTGTFGAAFMVLLAWNASNIASHSKKVTTNAMIMISFAVGNILGTQTFQAKQAPGYIDGKISIIVTLSALCFVIVILRVYDDVLNKQNERKLAEMGEAEKKELKEKMAFADQTDRKNVFFKYTH